MKVKLFFTILLMHASIFYGSIIKASAKDEKTGAAPAKSALQIAAEKMASASMHAAVSACAAAHTGRSESPQLEAYDLDADFTDQKDGAQASTTPTSVETAAAPAGAQAANVDIEKIKKYFKAIVEHIDTAYATETDFSIVEYAQKNSIPLEEWNVLINFADDHGWTLLTHAVSYAIERSVQELLLDEQINANHSDKWGRSILMNAVETCSLRIISILIESGKVNASWANHKHDTALSVALDMRMNPDSYTKSPNMFHDIPAIIDVLLDRGNANVLVANIPYSHFAQANLGEALEKIKFPEKMAAKKKSKEKKRIAEGNNKIIEKLQRLEQQRLKERLADLATNQAPRDIRQHFSDITFLLAKKPEAAPVHFMRLKTTLSENEFTRLLNFQDPNGRTLIFYCISNESVECVKLVVAERAHCNLNHVSKNTFVWFAHTPLLAVLNSKKAREMLPLIEPYVDYNVLVPRIYADQKKILHVTVLCDVIQENDPEKIAMLLASKRINTLFSFPDLEQAKISIEKITQKDELAKKNSDSIHRLLTHYETEKALPATIKRLEIEAAKRELVLKNLAEYDRKKKQEAALQATAAAAPTRVQKRKEKITAANKQLKAKDEKAQETTDRKAQSFDIAKAITQLIVDKAYAQIKQAHDLKLGQEAPAANPQAAAQTEAELALISIEQEMENQRLMALAHSQKSNAGRAAGKPKNHAKKKDKKKKASAETALVPAAQKAAALPKESDAQRREREAHERVYSQVNAKLLELAQRKEAHEKKAKEEELRLRTQKAQEQRAQEDERVSAIQKKEALEKATTAQASAQFIAEYMERRNRRSAHNNAHFIAQPSSVALSPALNAGVSEKALLKPEGPDEI